MSCRRYFYPIFRHQLLTIPFSPLKIQLAKFCHVFCTEKQSPAAFCNSFRTGFPVIFRDTKRTKQSRSQIFGQGFSCTFRHDCRKNISIQTVILKLRSGFSIDRCIQKASKPVISGHDTWFIKSYAACHGQQILYCDHRAENLWKGIYMIRKNVINIFIEL